MAIGVNLYIPLNIVTITIVALLGFSGFIMLILFSIFLF